MEEKIVTFSDGVKVKVIRNGNRFYLEEMKKEKQSNRHVMSHSTYVHNVVVREDTDHDSHTITETEEE